MKTKYMKTKYLKQSVLLMAMMAGIGFGSNAHAATPSITCENLGNNSPSGNCWNATSTDLTIISATYATPSNLKLDTTDTLGLDTNQFTSNTVTTTGLDPRGAEYTINTSTISIKDGVFATAADLAALQSQMATGTPVEYNDSTKAAITLGGAAGTTIDNLAPGALNATSMQAVNGAQLYATNQAVTALDGRVTKVEGDVTVLDGRVTKVEGDVTNMMNGGSGIKYFHAEGGATGADSVASGTKSVAMGQAAVASAANSVALGANSIADSVGTQVSTQTVAGVVYNVAGTTTGVVSVGAVGAERQLTNLSAGEVSFTSTDAINGSQLFATNTALKNAGLSNIHVNDVTGQGTGSTATGSGTIAIGDGATASGGNVAIGHDSVATTPAVGTAGTTINNQYYGFAGATPTETFSVGSPTNPREVTNVAAGQLNAGSTDAVNGSQLYATNQAVEGLGNEVNNLSSGLDTLRGDLGNTRKDAFAGIAGAMAMQLPHTAPGKVSMGVGMAEYKGVGAGAVTVAYTTKGNRLKVGGGVTASAHGTGVMVGMSFTLGKNDPAPLAQTGYDSSTYGAAYNQLNK